MKQTKFNGPEYISKRDNPRLGKQHLRIKTLMLDGKWRTLSEIEIPDCYLTCSFFNIKSIEKQQCVCLLYEGRVLNIYEKLTWCKATKVIMVEG